MTREYISKESLQNWLTSEVQKLDGCETCKFGGVIGLAELDSDGCNWSETISLSMAKVPREIYEPASLHIIQVAREKYNVSD